MSVTDGLRSLFDSIGENTNKKRVIDYISDEIEQGRTIKDILTDPYVKNRVPEEALVDLLGDPDIIDAVSAEVREAFQGFITTEE